MYRRIITWLAICLLSLVPLLGAAGPAAGQGGTGSVSGFPEAVIVESLAAGEVGALPTAPMLLQLDRVVMPAGAMGEARPVSAGEILYVESGAVTIVDTFGLSSTLSDGAAVHLRAGAAYAARNDGPDDVSFLRLSLSSPIASATPLASPVVDDGAGVVMVRSLATHELDALPAPPMSLFLARATWGPGVDSGPYTQNGPIGMLVEAGTLTISSPSGIDGQLGEGNAVLLPADQPLRTRNDGDSAAVALLFGVIPTGAQAITADDGSPASAATPSAASEAAEAPASSSASQPAPAQPTAAGTVLYQADMSGGFNEWPSAGGWLAVGGMLVNDGSSDTPIFASAPFEAPGSDYAVEVEMQWVRGGGTFGIIARGDDGGAGYWAGVGGYCGFSDRVRIWSGPPVNCSNDPFISTGMELDSDWHTLRLEVQGNTIRVLVDGAVVLETTDNRHLMSGQVGLWSYSQQVNIRRFSVIALGGEG